MARAHEDWVVELLAGLSRREQDELLKLLAKAEEPRRGGGVMNAAEAFPVARRGQGRRHHAQPPGEQESADVRVVCRIAGFLSRSAKGKSVKAIVVTGAGGNFCSGGDVHEIIGPLTKMTPPQLLEFTRMTGDLVKAMRHCPQPVIAAVEGVCAGAGAILAMASDLRYGAPSAKTAFLFVRVGLAGCDMGACAILPRIIGQGRAAELLYTGRSMSAEEGLAWGFFNRRRRSACWKLRLKRRKSSPTARPRRTP